MSDLFYKQSTLPGIREETVAPSSLPAKIGPYKIESLLSKGGTSLLYLAAHPETKETVVVKVLLPKYVNHPEMTQRFLKEAKIIALADHPNIVKLYGEGEWEGGLYIAMELIRGISLRQFIMQHSLSLKRSLEIVLQVSYALLHLHTHSVIHRDLKPENILITEEGEIKVIDFGIAQLHEDIIHPKPSQILGTPDYMSPEQKENPLTVTYASDIYSLGVIAYELILGKLSFGVINLSFLPPNLKKILSKTLAVSVSERYNDIVDLITDILNYLKSEELEKEKPESDKLKECYEILHIAGQKLCPAIIPDWPHIELSLAKFKTPEHFGLYYDFFEWPNESYALFIAQSLSLDIDGALFASSIEGMCQMYVHEKIGKTKEPFRPLPFMTALNSLVSSEIAASLLILSPWKDQLSFVCCGLSSLIRHSEGSETPHILTTNNPPLGRNRSAEFLETTDNWQIGDTLLFHSLNLGENHLDTELLQALKDNASLSPRRQADAILRQTMTSPRFTIQKHPKLLLTIQRTA